MIEIKQMEMLKDEFVKSIPYVQKQIDSEGSVLFATKECSDELKAFSDMNVFSFSKANGLNRLVSITAEAADECEFDNNSDMFLVYYVDASKSYPKRDFALRCMDRQKELWNMALEFRMQDHTLCTAGQRIYWINGDWSYIDRKYCGSYFLVCCDINGKIVWKKDITENRYFSLNSDGDYLYCICLRSDELIKMDLDGNVIAKAKADALRLYEENNFSLNDCRLMLCNNKIMFVLPKSIKCFSKELVPEWQYTEDEGSRMWIKSRSTVCDTFGRLYFFNGDRALVSVDAQGKKRWSVLVNESESEHIINFAVDEKRNKVYVQVTRGFYEYENNSVLHVYDTDGRFLDSAMLDYCTVVKYIFDDDDLILIANQSREKGKKSDGDLIIERNVLVLKLLYSED